jgi:hypothetical protein
VVAVKARHRYSLEIHSIGACPLNLIVDHQQHLLRKVYNYVDN